MKIRVEHEYIGAALMQIAEHVQFTAINSLQIKGARINNAFKINNNIDLLCKYDSEPNGGGEYVFNFQGEHLEAVNKITKHNDRAFVALVCVDDAEICCLSIADLNLLISNRKNSAGRDEDSYQILVTAEQGKSLRAYVNSAGKKRLTAGKMLTIARNAFPNALFS